MSEKLNDYNELDQRSRVLAALGGMSAEPLEATAEIEAPPPSEPILPFDPTELDELPPVEAALAVVAASPLSVAFVPDLDIAASWLAQFPSDESRRTMAGGLARCARMLNIPWHDVPWQDLRFEHTSFIRGRLIEHGYSTSTILVTLDALRGVLKHAWRLRRIDNESFLRAVDWSGIPKVEPPLRGREIEQHELDALRAHWQACGGAYGAFLAALFSLLLGAGLRASEACRLTRAAYDPSKRLVHVLRKGRKQVDLPLGDQETEAIDAWLPYRRDYSSRRYRTDALFLRVQQNDWVREGSPELTVRMVEQVCERVCLNAGIAKFAPHDLRRTFATRAGRAGLDPHTVQTLMSHEDPKTTARYDMRKKDELWEARRRVNIWAPLPSKAP
jgi:integrase/recombinase XerD